MTESLSPASIAARWKVLPPQHARVGRSNLSVALWQVRWKPTTEITLDPDPATHIVSAHLGGRARMEHYHDQQLRFRGWIPDCAVNVIPAGRRPMGRVQSDDVTFLQILVPVRELQQFADDNLRGPARFELRDCHYAPDPALSALCQMIADELPRSGPAQLVLDTFAQMIFLRLARRWSSHGDPGLVVPTRRAGLAPWQERRVKEYILDHLASDVTLAELAALVGISPTYLCTAFRRATGVPPYQWQMRQRVERAKTLLAETDATVAEIAAAVGYCNAGHFATVFRRLTRTTPSAWRSVARS